MDIWKISVEGPNMGILAGTVQKGQTVKITRMVTITYVVNVSDYLDEMDGEGETGISVESLIEREMDVMGISDVLDNMGDLDEMDDVVISVEID